MWDKAKQTFVEFSSEPEMRHLALSFSMNLTLLLPTEGEVAIQEE